MQREIQILPAAILRQKCAPVTLFDDALAALAEDMLETMYAAPGRGLAAPQIGVDARLFVIDATWKEGVKAPQVFVNPEIVAASTETKPYTEGCLSIPDRLIRIERPAEITLKWQDQKGAWHEQAFDGFHATVIQHERDHLDGILCIDYPEVAE